METINKEEGNLSDKDRKIQELLKKEDQLAGEAEQAIRQSREEFKSLRAELQILQNEIFANKMKGVRSDQKLLGDRDRLVEKIKTLMLRTKRRTALKQDEIDSLFEEFNAL